MSVTRGEFSELAEVRPILSDISERAPGLRRLLHSLPPLPAWDAISDLAPHRVPGVIRRGLHGMWRLSRRLASRGAALSLTAILDRVDLLFAPVDRILSSREGKTAAMGGDAVALLVQFSSDGQISDALLWQMRHYRDLGFKVVLISNSPALEEVSWQRAASEAALVLHRRNYGLDFGAWKDVLPLVLQRWPGTKEVLLINDSVIGPIHPLEPVVAAMRAAGPGFFGMVESHQGGPHLQSWFILARGPGAVADLARFLAALRLSRSKWLIVRRGELRFARSMRAAGHRVAAAFGYETLVDLALSRPHERRYLRAAIPLWVLGRDKKKLRAALLKHPVNPTHHFWRMLAGPARCPFVKVELLLRNPGRLPGVAGWPTLVPATSPCPPALLASHLLVKGGVDDGAWPARRAADAAPLPTLALRRRCLIIAELSIPQCRKYRVDQKAEMFRLLDTDCTILSWRDTERAANLLQTHSIVIFYRVPATAAVRRLIAEAQCLGLSVWFEIDDLVFDPEDYSQNPNLKQLPAQEVRGLLQGVEAYRQALALCRNAIASTAVLAERMRAVGQGNVLVVENALDSETLTLIEGLRPRAADGRIRLFYGSGTRTHDSDFALIAPALLRVAHRHPTMDIVLMGELALPPDLAALGERVRRLPGKPYGEYLALLAEADITVAPLVPGAFNDSKSNIKFLEAAMAGVPAVCSPRSAFAQVIEHGRTGFLAEGEEEWFDALDALAADPALRARLANAAREAVLRRYEPAVVARQQLAPLLHSGPARSDPRLHVLMVNAFFAPQTFGGATVLMEALARQLQARGDTRVSIFTTAPSGKVPLHGLQRESQDGMTVFRLGVQDQPNWTDVYWSDSFAELFREALRALAPDAVHIHCVQGIGGALVAACRAEGIPVAITLHDAWWLCQRQFLVTEQGRYCGQWRIDPKQCAACVDAPVEDRDRDQRLRGALTAADLLLAPSEHWRRFHIDNGVSPARIVTNTNGILVPRNAAPNDGPARLRFGFVGGAEPVKGYPLIRRVFQTLPRGDWELVLVNPEGAPARQHAWRANGRVRHVPPYQPTSADMFFSNIDVLLFPSQWPESFGLTVREALARHKWVIATDAGGQAEAVIPGVNGTLIPLGDDPEPLRHAVEALLNRQPELRGWHNPMAGSIRSVDDQTEELHSVLLGLTRIPHAATPSP